MEQNQTTTNWTKLDYTLKTAKERADFVANLPKDQLTNKKNLEFLANYIVMAMTPEEKKKKEILTDNRMVTINKRETSLQKLTDSFETGEDGLYNLIINDKNVLLTPKISITEKDIAEIPPLKDLIDSIELMEKMEKEATGKRKFKLKKQIIEMRQEQYIIKNLYRGTTALQGGNNGSFIRGFSKLDFVENITIGEDGEPVSDGLINFFN